MRTISIAALKAQLSAQVRIVKEGETIIVLEHKHPVACLCPIPKDLVYTRRASKKFSYRKLRPLIEGDPAKYLSLERGDR